jgi:plasmid stabilization system protein ParE
VPELKLVWAPEAETDLLLIWNWGASRFSREAADAHLRDINRAIANLTKFPHAGVACDYIVPGVHPTVVFYRTGSASIDIVRVVDGRRNLAALFPRDEGA